MSRHRRMMRGSTIGIALALAVFAITWIWQRSSGFEVSNNDAAVTQAASAGPRVAPETPEEIALGTRPVYRYSVVPGGVQTPEELETAIATDSVVAAHYEGVNPDALRVERLHKPVKAHVSYRIGDEVYWTSKKVTIQAGEQVLTDGKTTIRARCGNQVSVEPLLPASDPEPVSEVFDQIVAPVPTSIIVRPIAAQPYVPPAYTAAPSPAGNGGSGTALPGPTLGPGPVIGYFGGGGSNPPPASGPGTKPPGVSDPPSDPPGRGDPSPPVPEPPAPTPPVPTPPIPPVPIPTPPFGPPVGTPPFGDPPDPTPPVLPPPLPTPPAIPQQPLPVPEPGTVVLLTTGGAVLILRHLRRRRAK